MSHCPSSHPMQAGRMTDAEIIMASLEAVSERCEDPAPLVYQRMFAKHPDMLPLFALDTDNAAREHMLHETLMCVLDLCGEGAYAHNFIANERQNHDQIGVPPEVFDTFYLTMAETFAEILGDDWTPEFDTAWKRLIAKITSLTLPA